MSVRWTRQDCMCIVPCLQDPPCALVHVNRHQDYLGNAAQENNPRILEPRASSLCVTSRPWLRRVAGGPSSLSVTLAAFPVVAHQPKTTQLKKKKHTRKCVDLIPGCKWLCPLRRAPAGGHQCREVHVPPAASLPGRIVRRPYKTIAAQIHSKITR